MNKLGILLLTAAAATALSVGCSDETGTTSTTTTTSSSSSASSSGAGGEMNNLGDMPSYGAQIDRMGRPAINTALNNTFNTNSEQKDQAKDAWNANAERGEWVATYKAEVAKNLAILDALNGMCGDQILAGAQPTAGRYDMLAGVLADDRLWLNTDGTSCDVYLAVEANATILPNEDCGGRALYYDVIDTSYSTLAKGTLSGVDDGIGKPKYVNGETFPYLADPGAQ